MNSHWPISFVVAEAILKTSLVLAVVGLCCLALRKRLPAASHMFWVLGFAAAIAMPVLAPFVPGRDVMQIHPAVEHQFGGFGLVPIPSPSYSAVGGSTRVSTNTPVLVEPAQSTSDDEVPTWLRIASIIWLIGFVAVGLRTAIGLYALRILKRFGTVPFDFDAHDLDVDAVARKAKQGRDWELRQAANANMTVPMTWGIFRPIVVLPKNAESWLEQRLEAVLLHELAHVRRYDFASQLLADLACALYWFNPIAWVGAHAMRADAELAADDSVLQAGVKPSDYASELLQLAADVGRRRQPFAYLGTPAMSNSKIESRLKSVLAPSAGRRGITSIQALAAVAFVALAVPGLAGLHATTRGFERPDSEGKEALSRAKQIALASIMYSADFDDVFPYVQQTASACAVLDPYMKNPKMFESPTKDGRFLFNLNLGGVLMTAIENPAKTPMWMEVLPDKSDPFAVAFVDGHAKIIAPDARAEIIKASKIRFPRTKTSLPLPADYMVPKKKADL